ncbi:hypothetical protein BAY60_03120 [Prauserella muralis]|uniref:Glycosyl hydrolase family 43 n=1 Tax=Prauserella muralis TaxID=588067 RepID=A0A2V4BC99_9PSEU|nr:hypothetical protein BAY60_03120 [Prauserella muralis]
MTTLTAAGSLLLTLLGIPPAPASKTAPRPQLAENFPDPEVSRFGGWQYGYATGSKQQRVPYAMADAGGHNWRLLGDALPTPPAWAAPDVGAWAPDVSRRPRGDYLMYFSMARAGDRLMCLGAALAPTPAGPFQPVGREPLLCQPELHGTIDPASFVRSDGSRYLLYKTDSHPARIWLRPTTPDGLRLAGPAVELLRADRPHEDGVVEAPVLVERPSAFVLLYAANDFRSRAYQTRYATAPTLGGPYTKAGRALLTTDSVGVRSPGGADVAGHRLYFHGWLPGAKSVRALYGAPLRWDGPRPVAG